jgi:chorismate-pyruvate lyase
VHSFSEATRRVLAKDPMAMLDELYSPFSDQADRSTVEFLPGDQLPQPYRHLLVHNHHMTVTVEEYYGGLVDVRVLDAVQHGYDYARKIVLIHRDSGKVVQFGIVRVDLAVLDPEVRDRIVSGHTPLGRVLIESNVLRTVRPIAYYRVVPNLNLAEWLGSSKPTYGRLGLITAGDRPCVRVAEILTAIDFQS